LLAAQGNVCKICNNPFSQSKKRRFDIDHNHKTGKVRKLLCQLCNSGIVKFKENIETFKNAIKYLEDNK
jgi:hypothetical protein